MGKGGKVKFYGAFGDKSKAETRAKSVGGYIEPITVKGQKRYIVVKDVK